MTTTDADDPLAAAAAWHAGTGRDDFDWAGFTRWLEADPRHREAYDAIARTDALVGDHAAALMEHHAWSEDAIPPRRAARTRWWVGGGALVAAGVAAAVLMPSAPVPRDAVWTTGDASAAIALGDGSQAMLAPHSRLAVAPGGRALRLQGEAWLEIRHRPGRALTVSAGGLTVTDVGTRFDVAASTAGVRVSVAEGAVNVAAPGLAQPLALGHGQQVVYDAAVDSADVARVDPATVGGWRSGHLTYSGAPVSLVAADLARYAGVPIAVAPAVRTRRFSGTLALAGAGNGATAVNAQAARRALDDLAGLMGLAIVRGPRGWLITAAAGR